MKLLKQLTKDRINSIKSCPEVKSLIEKQECEYDDKVMLDSEFAEFFRDEKIEILQVYTRIYKKTVNFQYDILQL